MANLSWISSNPDYINQMIRNTQVTLSNNYNDLDNIPIIKITSTTNNPQKIWGLKEGLYMIDGVVQVDNNISYEVSNLLISMTARLENGKYILSAFIPYLRGLFEYILKTNSTEYEQHQKIVLMIKNDTLTLDNETIYTPIEDYHPATKKYVDDKANEIVTELDRMGVNKENLESLNKENRIRDIKLQALLSETSDRNITIEENVRYFDMPLSIDNGIVTINEIVGETLVNVCDQEESVAITKSYTVENENHIALQGEYDGSCRPVVYGNTLVNHNADWNGKVQTGVETSASGIEDVQVEGTKGQEVSVVVEGNTVLNHALGKTSAVVSGIEDNLWDFNYIETNFGGGTINYSSGRIFFKQTKDYPYTNIFLDRKDIIKPNTYYTLIVDMFKNTLSTNAGIILNSYSADSYDASDVFTIYGASNDGREGSQNKIYGGNIGRFIYKLKSKSDFSVSQYALRTFVGNTSQEGELEFSIKLLEGDHTTNPKYVNSNEGNYVDLTVANDMSSVVEIEGRTMVNLVNHKLYEAQHLRAVSYDEVNKEYSMTIDNYTFPAFAIKLNYSTTLNKTYFISFKMKATATKNFKYNITHFDVYSAWNVGGEEYTLTENYQTFTKTFTSTADEYLGLGFSFLRNDNNEFSDIVINIKDIMIFEGDLTQTPHLIPSGYVEGLKSSYECEVTEDGKYKVDVKVTGKNKFKGYDEPIYLKSDTKYFLETDETESATRIRFKAYKNGEDVTEKIKIVNNSGNANFYYHSTKIWFSSSIDQTKISTIFTLNGDFDYVIFHTSDNVIPYLNTIIEEGTVATSYEPYFESSKTFYLNSPLLEGDKIVTKNGKVYHYHKMGKVVLDGSRTWWGSSNINGITFMATTSLFNLGTSDRKMLCDSLRVNQGFNQDSLTDYNEILAHKSSAYSNACYISTQLSQSDFINWLKSNPITVVYELDTPYYELIDEYSNTILNIPKNVAHLTHTSAVPVNNTVFTNYKDELNVLEANTQYRLMFDCDKANVPFTITLGGTSQEVTSKNGTHSLLITTPSELVDKNLVIDGIGRCGIDNIRIFKGDVEYDYVKGLWSGYEERKLENLINDDMYTLHGDLPPSVEVNNDNEIKATSNSNCIMVFGRKLINIKPYKIYTVICDVQTTLDIAIGFGTIGEVITSEGFIVFSDIDTNYNHIVCKLECKNDNVDKITIGEHMYVTDGEVLNIKNLLVLEGDWTDNPPTYEEVMANEGKYAVKVKLDTNATIFGKGGRL